MTEHMAEHASETRTLLLEHERMLGRKVQRLREERGWSQADLARRLGEVGFEMHQTTVAKMEAGKRPLRVAEMFALAHVFGLPPLAVFYMSYEGEGFGMGFMRERLADLDTQTAGDALRRLADILDAAPEAIPADALGSLFVYGRGDDVRPAWAALRGVVTDPSTLVEITDATVRVTAPGLPVLTFSAGMVGSRRTVTREVTEYVLDDAAVSA